MDNGAVTNAFGYNLRSELTDAAMGTNQFGYAYDPIGNLTNYGPDLRPAGAPASAQDAA